MRYKQIKAIIDLMVACDEDVTVNNIQKVAKVMGITIADQELEYLLAILSAMGGVK